MQLLDSNILIYNAKPGGEFLDPVLFDPESCISAISIPEVLGFESLNREEQTVLEAVLIRLRLIAVEIPALHRAAGLRRIRRMKLGDSIIAATALEYGFELVTRNIEDFKHIPALRLINPFDQHH